MIWQNPWAWAGLIVLGAPIIIHLLGRGRAKVQPFPTLRFLHISRVLPTRRTRLQDLLLLAIRLGILLSAIAALAQPLFLTADRRQSVDATLLRAVIVDTSASMGPIAAAVRDTAAATLRQATSGIMIQTDNPRSAIAGAVAWLEQHNGRAELAIISDFQAGAIDSADLAQIPPAVGISLRALTSAQAGSNTTRSQAGDRVITTTANVTAGLTHATWRSETGSAPRRTQLLTPEPVERVNAATRAAGAIGVPLPTDSSISVSILFPGAPEWAQLVGTSKPITRPASAGMIAALATDALLTASLVDEQSIADTLLNRFTPVQRNQSLVPRIVAGQSEDGDTLLLFTSFPVSSVGAATLINAIDRVSSLAPNVGEASLDRTAPEILRRWERPAATDVVLRTVPGEKSDSSDGRWFWAGALALLALESVVRRSVALAKAAV